MASTSSRPRRRSDGDNSDDDRGAIRGLYPNSSDDNTDDSDNDNNNQTTPAAHSDDVNPADDGKDTVLERSSDNNEITASSLPSTRVAYRVTLPVSNTHQTTETTATVVENKEKADAAPAGISSNSFPLYIVEERSRGIAFQLWPAATVMCRWLEQQPVSMWSSRNIIELGAGCGMVGMAAAVLGAHVIVTDMTSVIGHLHQNLLASFDKCSTQIAMAPRAGDTVPLPPRLQLLPPLSGSIRADHIMWGEACAERFPSSSIHHIMLADCLYWEHLFDPLLNTLLQLTAPSTSSSVPASHTHAAPIKSSTTDTTDDKSSGGGGGEGPIIWLTQSPRRHKIEQRFFKAAQRHFTVTEALKTKYQPDDRTFVTIYRLQRKPLSASTVPPKAAKPKAPKASTTQTPASSSSAPLTPLT